MTIEVNTSKAGIFNGSTSKPKALKCTVIFVPLMDDMRSMSVHFLYMHVLMLMP